MRLYELHADIMSAVKDFISKYWNDDDEWGAPLKELCSEAGACAMVSETLRKYLVDRKIPARLLTGEQASNEKWAEVVDDAGEGDAHTVVVVGNDVIDLTAKQFDSKFPVPRIYSVEQFKKEWKEVK